MTDRAIEASESDIAIIGRACRFPGAPDIAALWRVFRDGVETITHYSDEDMIAAGVPAEQLKNPNYVKASGHLENVEMFDAGFFGFGPKDAAITDPQHRHFMECCWEALEDAGHPPVHFDGTIGVFAGCGMNSYFIYNLLTNREILDSAGVFLLRHTGNDRDFLPTTVSYKLNLTGPSVAVQTACSTSLVAIHFGVQSLLSGECDMVLAGGVTVKVPHRQGYVYADNEPLDPTGHCRAFDARGAGTVFASGAGVVVLRRLAEALEDGDDVHAVIKGSAVNNDGSRKVGYFAPSVDGYAAVVTEALAVADVPAESISYLETHGTGTHVGDPIEISALTQAFRQSTDATQFCAIGSSKPNIGHTDNAAGVASVLKVIEALEHRQLPPSINYDRPNPSIDFESSPFAVNTKLRDWTTAGGAPRRAGVSSLGVGGTNAHVILEEAPPRDPPAPATRPLEVIPISAKSPAALENTTRKLAHHFRESADLQLPDAAHTLQIGRESFEHRRVVVCRSAKDAANVLLENDPKRVISARAPSSESAIAFMFPGGGAQYPGMGRGLYESEPVFRRAMDECLELLKPHLDFDLRSLMYPRDGVTEEGWRQLSLLGACMPGILATEVALTRLWNSWGVEASAMTGHSLGEYTAAYFAGVISLADALAMVSLRGRLVDSIQEPGRMLSVQLPEAELADWLGDDLDLAASNAPSLCTVSGNTKAIDDLARRLEEREIGYSEVRLPSAVHCRLLDPILADFRRGISGVALHPPTKRYISNVSGDWIRPEDATDPDYWVRHLRQTVRWSAGLEKLLASGSFVLLEAGPGQTLSSLARQQSKRPVAAASSLRHPDDDTPDLQFMLTAFGRLWANGVAVDWEALRGGERRRRVSLPTYGFDRQAYWVEPGRPSQSRSETSGIQRIENVDDWFYRPAWRPAPAQPAAPGDSTWLVFADESGLGAAVIAELESSGQRVVSVKAGDAFYRLGEREYAVSPEAGLDGYTALIQDLAANDRLPDRIVHLWQITTDETARAGSSFFHRVEERGFYSLFHLAQALGGEDVTHPIHIAVVTNGMQSVNGEVVEHPEKATLLGPIAVIPQEFPNVTCQSIDLPPATRGRRRRKRGHGIAAYAGQLCADIHPERADSAIAYRGDDRLEQFLETVRRDELPQRQSRLRDGGCYLITGGLGGLGLLLAEHLARTRQAKLVLVSRSTLPARTAWEDWLETHGSTDPTSRKLRTLLAIESLGGEVMVASADVANVERMGEVVSEAQRRFGSIHGVFHVAGAIDDGLIQGKSQGDIERVFASKIQGTLVLSGLLEDARPDLFVLFSSSSSVLGPAGQVDYVAASSFLNAFAESRRSDSGIYTVAIDWGVWRDVGLAVETYRRVGGQGASGPPVARPLLDRRGHGDSGADVFQIDFDGAERWILDEHRTAEGNALVPGTGYLEMVHSAFTEAGGPACVEIRNITFVSPLAVGDGESVSARLTLTPSAKGRDFEIESRSGDSIEWRLHAQGSIAGLENGAVARLPISEIEARCPRLQEAGDGEGLHTLHEEQLKFGPRWRSIRSMRLGKGEAIARLRLPEPFQRDLDEYSLHPALLDMATGFATPLIEGYTGEGLWAPMAYGRVRVHAALPAEIVSHVRNAAENTSAGGTAKFDITISDPKGAVLLEIEDFTLRRLSNREGFGARTEPNRPAGTAPAHEARAHSAAERVFQRSYELGISPEEGLAALERILAGGTLPRIYVSSMNLPALVDAMRAQPEGAPSVRFSRPQLETDFIAPRDDVERKLAEMWQELLGVSEVGVMDDFFELGGHSLIAVRLFAKIKKLWDIEWPISVLFDAPNIEKCAELLRAELGMEFGQGQSDAAPRARHRFLVPLQRGDGDRPPFFLVAGMFGNVLNLRHIATHLGRDQTVWALQAKGLLGDDEPHETFEDMACDYLAEVRSVQPRGPYYLGGFSGGGLSAFEMAQQLEQVGEEVAAVVLLDSLPAENPELSRRDRVVLNVKRMRRDGLAYAFKWLGRRVAWEIEKLRSRFEAAPQRDLTPAEFRSEQIEAAFRNALPRYRTGIYAGKLILIRPSHDGWDELRPGMHLSPARVLVDHENRWGPHARDGVEVHVVPGDHDNMVLEPNVRVLAARLRVCLDEAIRKSGSPAS